MNEQIAGFESGSSPPRGRFPHNAAPKSPASRRAYSTSEADDIRDGIRAARAANTANKQAARTARTHAPTERHWIACAQCGSSVALPARDIIEYLCHRCRRSPVAAVTPNVVPKETSR